MHVIFATYLQNVTTLPCKMAIKEWQNDYTLMYFEKLNVWLT